MGAARRRALLLCATLFWSVSDGFGLARREVLERMVKAVGVVGVVPWARPAGAMWQLWTPQDLMTYVDRYAKQDDAASVLAAMDLAAETSWMMNFGPEKGAILEELVRQRTPKRVLELGTFCGYSTIRMARHLPPDSVIVTVEKDPNTFKVAKKVLAKAGLLNKTDAATPFVDMRLAESSSLIPALAKEFHSMDFVLMDHWKDLYDVDLRSMDAHGLITTGCYVVADNVRFPGAPRYLDYLYNGYGGLLYNSRIIEVPFEYRPDQPDGICVSIRNASPSLDRNLSPTPEKISDRMQQKCQQMWDQAAKDEEIRRDGEPAPQAAQASRDAGRGRAPTEEKNEAPKDVENIIPNPDMSQSVVEEVICEALERVANDGSGVASTQ